jgi:hypothetical protein
MTNLLPSVRERLARANEELIKKNGVDPYHDYYRRRKRAIVYAWEHNMTYQEALAVLTKPRKQK